MKLKANPVAYRSLPYGAALFILAIAQTSFFSIINILGAPPDLLLGATLAFAMLENSKICTVCGIVSGFFYCALGSASPSYILFSFAAATVLSRLSLSIPKKNLPSYLALAAITYGAKGIYNIAEHVLGASSPSPFSALWYMALPEFISSMIFCPISYFAVRLLAKRLTGGIGRTDN